MTHKTDDNRTHSLVDAIQDALSERDGRLSVVSLAHHLEKAGLRVIPAEPAEKRHYVVEARLPITGSVVINEMMVGEGWTLRDRIIHDLIHNQFNGTPHHVFELVDASAEIAQAVANKLHSDGYPASKELRPFLERHGADEKVPS